MCVVFFFQGEEGIRDDLVTGVQRCALPTSVCRAGSVRPPVRRTARAVPRMPRRASLTASSVGNAAATSGSIRTDRKSVVSGKSVDLGGRRIIKKKKKKNKWTTERVRQNTDS